MRIIFFCLKIIAVVMILFAGGAYLLSYFSNSPIQLFVVLSGSMSPAISPGSVVLVQRDNSNIRLGEVITFINPNQPSENITHRVIGKVSQGNKTLFQTGGDTNPVPDVKPVGKESVWGKVFLTIPYLGYLVAFSKTKLGVLLTVALPLIYIAFCEILVIINEVKKIKNRSKIELERV